MLIPVAQLKGQGRAGEPKFEAGAGVVGSFYDKRTLTSAGGSADAGFAKGYGASFWLGNNMYSKISGEIRYDLLWNDLSLQGAGGKASFGSSSHAFHYDLHFHLADTTSKVRPFIIAGGGAKMYRGTGQERAFQPLSNIAVLTKANELAALLTFGIGVKVKLTDRVTLRVDFRDNVTRFPKKLIAPNKSTGGDGWINNFAPSAGLSLLF